MAAQGGAVVFTDHREAITETHAGGAHAITDGRVTLRGGPQSDGPASVLELLLTLAPTGAVPDEVDWPALPGVLDAARRGPRIVLRVTRAHSDAVLTTALQRRWSVGSVTGAAHDHVSGADARSVAR
ncbi:hypothetical protein [Kitasatospora sp. Root107]|uniref:hypothetical protein n=1 Tax=Kitasatospora sp. Root107 TaxID=1736424 RepID=UPI000ADB9D1C